MVVVEIRKLRISVDLKANKRAKRERCRQRGVCGGIEMKKAKDKRIEKQNMA